MKSSLTKSSTMSAIQRNAGGENLHSVVQFCLDEKNNTGCVDPSTKLNVWTVCLCEKFYNMLDHGFYRSFYVRFTSLLLSSLARVC